MASYDDCSFLAAYHCLFEFVYLVCTVFIDMANKLSLSLSLSLSLYVDAAIFL